MTSPWYNPATIAPHTRAQAERINDEFAKIAAALDQLPAPNAIGIGAGTPNYTHYAYADSADGSANFTTGASNGRSYVGVAANRASATPPGFNVDYVWSRLTGTNGSNGTNGTNGRYREFRFVRSLSRPAAAVGSAPAGTFAEPPVGSNPLWATSALRDGNGVLTSAWSVWERISAMPAPAPYVAGTTYYLDMQALFGGGTYILIVETSLGNAPTGTAQANAQWAVIAAPGQAGAPAVPPGAFSTTINLTSSSSGVNLRTIADANGFTGNSNATVTFNVPTGVTITGMSGGGIGIDSGVWPSSSYTIALTLVVQSGGVVHGGGGVGGTGASGGGGAIGGNGGDGVYLRQAMSGGVTIDAGGILRAGGGGGGGGASGAGSFGPPTEPDFANGGGGGGGGGFPNGAGGAGGLDSVGTPATSGSSGTTSGGGTGGAGEPQSGFAGGAGGAGGTFAAAGSVGANAGGYSGGSAGAAGYAVRKNGLTATVTNNGTLSGTVG